MAYSEIPNIEVKRGRVRHAMGDEEGAGSQNESTD
jgi:hypothetical protein